MKVSVLALSQSSLSLLSLGHLICLRIRSFQVLSACATIKSTMSHPTWMLSLLSKVEAAHYDEGKT